MAMSATIPWLVSNGDAGPGADSEAAVTRISHQDAYEKEPAMAAANKARLYEALRKKNLKPRAGKDSQAVR